MGRKFSNWLEKYIEYSSYSEAPENFHFWTGVSVIAGALRRRVWIDMGYFQWTPNFYIVFVAPPGIVSKSTTASIGMRLLKSLPDIKFGPDAVTWPALTQALAESTEEILLPDGLTYSPMSCITIVSSEFGTFLNPNDREMVDVLVSLWDGQLGTWEKVTKTQGSDLIVNPWINILAATTPSWIAGNFPDYMIGGGFTSRCVFVYGDTKRHLVAYPSQKLPTNFQKLAEDLVHDLEQIAMLVGEYQLDKEAIIWGEKWYEHHYATLQDSELDEATFGGYQARKQTHIHKLAIVLAASRRDELVITKRDLMDAEKHITALEKTMPKVFALIGRSTDARTTEIVHGFIQRFKVVDKTILYQELIRTLSADEIGKALQALLAADLVIMVQANGRVLIKDKSYLKEDRNDSNNGASRLETG